MSETRDLFADIPQGAPPPDPLAHPALEGVVLPRDKSRRGKLGKYTDRGEAKRAFLIALYECGGDEVRARKKVGVPPQTVDRWRASDARFDAAVERTGRLMLGKAMGVLSDLLEDPDPKIRCMAAKAIVQRHQKRGGPAVSVNVGNVENLTFAQALAVLDGEGRGRRAIEAQ